MDSEGFVLPLLLLPLLFWLTLTPWSMLQPSEPKENLYRGTLGCGELGGTSSIKLLGAQHFRIQSEVSAVSVDSCVKKTKLRLAKSILASGS